MSPEAWAINRTHHEVHQGFRFTEIGVSPKNISIVMVCNGSIEDYCFYNYQLFLQLKLSIHFLKKPS
jgi:hypothetical protein